MIRGLLEAWWLLFFIIIINITFPAITIKVKEDYYCYSEGSVLARRTLLLSLLGVIIIIVIIVVLIVLIVIILVIIVIVFIFRFWIGGLCLCAESAKRDETPWSIYDEPLATAS